MKPNFRAISTLGRPVDIRYRSNRFIAGFIAVVLFGTFAINLANNHSVDKSGVIAFNMMLTTFVAWAIGRELDPDFNLSAYLAAPLAIIVAVLWDPPAILAIAGTMFAIRLVNRTVGPPPTTLDLGVLVIASGLLSAMGHPIVGAGIGMGIGLNHFLPKPDHSRSLPTALLALIAVGIGTIIALPIDIDWTFDPIAVVVIISITVLYLYATRHNPSTPESSCDLIDEKLNPTRILVGQYIALAIGMLNIIVFANDGVLILSALWVGFLSVGIRGLYQRFLSSNVM